MSPNARIMTAVVFVVLIGWVVEALYCAAVGNVPTVKGLLDAGFQAVGFTMVVLSVLMFWIAPDRKDDPADVEKVTEQ